MRGEAFVGGAATLAMVRSRTKLSRTAAGHECYMRCEPDGAIEQAHAIFESLTDPPSSVAASGNHVPHSDRLVACTTRPAWLGFI